MVDPNVIQFPQDWRKPGAQLSDKNLALWFACSPKGADHCFSEERDIWRHFNGVRWVKDHKAIELQRDVRELLNEVEHSDKAKEPKVKMRIGSNACLNAVVKELTIILACSEDIFDQDPWLITCSDGQAAITMSLKQFGKKHSPRREDYITKCMNGVPEGDCPRWIEFVEEVMSGDKDKIAYMQKVAGYCMFGGNSEQILFFLHGAGNNGKSKFIEALQYVMGDYAASVPSEVFMTQKWSSAKIDEALVKIKGSRLVVSSEIDPLAKWNVAILKQLSGEDRIDACAKWEKMISFHFGGTLMIIGNNKPRLLGVDKAIRRRFHIVPFDADISEERRDKFIGDKFKAEANGILKWMIDGCYLWQTEGLEPPQAVRKATDDYFKSQDLMNQWLDDECDINFYATTFTSTLTLYASWKDWCEANGHIPGASNGFSEKLKAVDADGPNGTWKLGEHHRQGTVAGKRCWGFFKIKLKV